jgi:hypothetical protein
MFQSSSSYFKTFISALNPNYKLPSRIAFSGTLVPNLAWEREQDTVDDLANALYVSRSTDTWT